MTPQAFKETLANNFLHLGFHQRLKLTLIFLTAIAEAAGVDTFSFPSTQIYTDKTALTALCCILTKTHKSVYAINLIDCPLFSTFLCKS
jgi:hypothetical protein